MFKHLNNALLFEKEQTTILEEVHTSIKTKKLHKTSRA